MGDTVVAVAAADVPGAGVGEGFEIVRRVVHEYGAACGLEHGDIVPVVADGEDPRGVAAIIAGECEQGRTLGTLRWEHVEDTEIARGVLGAMQCEPVWGRLRCVAGDYDAGAFEQARLGAGHALDGPAEHGLNGRVGLIVEGALDGLDLDDIGFVEGHPAADAGGEPVELLDDERAAAVFPIGQSAVEGEDERVAKVSFANSTDVVAEPECGGARQVGAGEEPGGACAGVSEGACDGAVGADKDRVVGQAERAEDAHGEAVAAPRGDDDPNARGLGGAQGGEVARADAAVRTEQRAVHVYCDQAD